MATGSATAGGSSSRLQEDKVLPLSGEVIYLPNEHFDDLGISIMKLRAKELGAEFSYERDKCTIILYNEHSPLWPAQSEEIAEDASTSDRSPKVLPYHWLSICFHRNKRVPISDLPTATPYMIQQLTACHPLKIWVSKNVNRRPDESPEDAHRNVVYDVESVGAITVAKRADSDVLVVDRQSKFFAVVEREKEENQRDWQKLAQRDWVDFCLASKVLQLTTPRDDEAISVKSEPSDEGDQLAASNDDEEVDSMMAEEDMPVGRGPGRPTGKPRVEYTPEDDDFLCRWLACHYPGGAWGSRKTYQVLFGSEDQYPPARRHSSQSWHERFKKNSNAFSRRVQRFIAEGVNETLKTREERKQAAEKKRQERASEQAAAKSRSPELARPEATSSRQTRDPRNHVDEDDASTSRPINTTVQGTKRALVESDSEEPLSNRVDRKGKKRAVEGEANRVLVPETLVADARMEMSGPIRTSEPDVFGPISAVQPTDNVREPSVVQSAAIPVADSSPRTDRQPDTNIPTQELRDSSSEQPVPNPSKPVARGVLDDIPVQPASALLGNLPNPRHSTPANAPSVHEGNEHAHKAASTPLRQEIQRSMERRKRRGQSSGRRSLKRAPTPDQVYAFVNVPPPRPVVVDPSIPAPQPAPRSPPRELTPVERAESVLNGSRIVQDIAAQYRAKVAALRQRFGVGVKEISAATNEVKRRTGGKSAVDWGMLEAVLEEQYGRS